MLRCYAVVRDTEQREGTEPQQPTDGVDFIPPPATPAPPTSHCILNFYHLVDIEHPLELLHQHQAFLEGRGVRGRIYISRQGINAQCGGVTSDVVDYVHWLSSVHGSRFGSLRYKLYPAIDHAFPRLRLKYRPNLISLAGGMAALPVTDLKARATPLRADKWREMLEQARKNDTVVLDIRNAYEWDAGHFEGAERPQEEEFNETPTCAVDDTQAVPSHLENVAPNTPIMMYCTGGIRCDVYSTHLRSQGFTNLYTLEGGVQEYFEKEGSAGWKGSLYVFDGRMAVPSRPLAGTDAESLQEAELEAAVPCQLCGDSATLPHMNCANIDCNKLFIACPGCRTSLKGCCSESCQAAPRLLRPAKQGGLYGNWQEYAKDLAPAEACARISSGRNARRAERRRLRLAAERERLRAKHAEQVQRRAAAGEAMRERALQLEERRAHDPSWVRLQEARERLLERKASSGGITA